MANKNQDATSRDGGRAAQQIEDEVVDPRRDAAEVLQEIELRAAAVVANDQLSIDDSSSGQAGKRLDDVRELLAEGILAAGEEAHGATGPSPRSWDTHRA